MLGILERFGGYTYTTLMAEDPELLRLISIQTLARPDPEEGSPQLAQTG